MTADHALVTLLTDFGTADTYVGQVKGAILNVAPRTTIVDLTHDVPAQDVRTGAFLLWTAVESFAPGTIHVAVVDPGVGTERHAIAAQTLRGDILVGPDNGLLVPAFERLGGCDRAVRLAKAAFWASRPSRTFHGRDVFGPVAGHLARGTPIEALGPALDTIERPFIFPRPVRDDQGVIGEVLHVDRYGNLITNITADLLGGMRGSVLVENAEAITGAPHPHYQAVPAGKLLAVVGSQELLEVSLRDGSAALATGASIGTRVNFVFLEI